MLTINSLLPASAPPHKGGAGATSVVFGAGGTLGTPSATVERRTIEAIQYSLPPGLQSHLLMASNVPGAQFCAPVGWL